MNINRQLAEIASWRIASELCRCFPDTFSLIQTHPGGGMYDCLSLYIEGNSHFFADFNRVGSGFSASHEFERGDIGGRLRESGGGIPLWEMMVENENPKDNLAQVCRRLNLEMPSKRPPSNPKIIVYRFIADFLSHASFGKDLWTARGGYFDSSGMSECGPVKDFNKFRYAAERVRKHLPDDADTPENRFWFLHKNDEPVLCLETTGMAWTLDHKQYNLYKIYKNNGRKIWPMILEVAGHLLP